PALYSSIRTPPRSTLFPTRRSSDLEILNQRIAPRIDADGGGARLISGLLRAPDHNADSRARKARPVAEGGDAPARLIGQIFKIIDRKSTRLNSSHVKISYAVFCLKK